MQRPAHFSSETTLYHPQYGSRVFLKGEQDPGAAWFDNEACSPPSTEDEGAVKRLAAVMRELEQAEHMLAAREHDIAKLSAAKEAAEAQIHDLEQRALAAERARDEMQASLVDVTKDRDAARSHITTLERQVAAFDHDGDGKPGGRAKRTA